jgi:hypothetical protein
MTTDDNIDIDLFLSLIATNQTIIVQDQVNSDNYQNWIVNSTPTQTIDSGGTNNYWTIPITYINSGGTGATNFANNLSIFIAIFSAQGTNGTSGSSGTSGGTGSSGSAGSSGTSGSTVKSINIISTNTTAGSAVNTDYTYLASGTINVTLPTAVANTNNYYIKNIGSGTVTILTTSSQTIDGSLSAPLPVPYTSLTLVSDQSNWFIV